MNKDRCKHWAGRLSLPDLESVTHCRAGVEYASVSGGGKGIKERLPCMKRYELNNCAKREFPTSQELEEWNAGVLKELEFTDKARKAIIDNLGGRPGSTEVACPKCGGFLRGSLASNGHVWGACEKTGCLAWME